MHVRRRQFAVHQDDVTLTGHAIEIRINAEDPAEGAYARFRAHLPPMSVPGGYGVRWDGGYEAGDEISQYYDNLVGKLICWGDTREIAIARTLRALREFKIEGTPMIPADIAILEHPDFQAGEHSTKWVEEVLDLTGISAKATPRADDDDDLKVKRQVEVEVNGKRFDVTMWVPESALAASPTGTKKKAKRRSGAGSAGGGSGSGDVAVPMAGHHRQGPRRVGQVVEVGQTIVVSRSDEDGKQRQRRKGRHDRRPRSRRAIPSAVATSWPRSTNSILLR
ncbi:MAG: hypothetical protein R2706_19990 [Acidimicrobiales bacterium]